MAKTRTYRDACGMARALDRVGERWALMVVRELLLGPKRFTDVRAGLPGLSADVLAQRLRELEEAGILRRRRLGPPAPAQVYELTEWGRELAPVCVALGRWGARAENPPPGVGMSLDAHIVSLQTLFDPVRAAGFSARVALRLDGAHFGVVIADGEIDAGRGEPSTADATITASAGTFIDVVHGRRALADARATGELTSTGEPALVERFLGLFPLPEPAQPPLAAV